MKISMDILKDCLAEEVSQENILQESGMSIDSYELYDTDTILQENYLYICHVDELPEPQNIPFGFHFICYGRELDLEEYKHIDLLVTKDTSFKKLLNEVLTVVKKYTTLDEEFEKLILKHVPLQEILDMVTDIVGMPLCMLDMNHNVLAISSKVNASNDLLWDAMKQGYGYRHYDIVSQSEPKIHDMAKAPSATVELISNISGNYLKVSLLYYGHHAFATLGMHRTGSTEELKMPFHRSTIQLFNYVVRKFTRHLALFPDVKVSRGLLYEQFLLDILEGKIKDQNIIQKFIKQFGLSSKGLYQLCLIAFKNEILRTDHHFELMSRMEFMLPNSKCLMVGHYIMVIFPSIDRDYMSVDLQKKLETFLDINGLFCILSPVFKQLNELSAIFGQVEDVLGFITDKSKHLYHYYQFAELYCMKILSEHVPMYTMYHPMIQKLIDYDEKYKMDYMESLKVYLRNNCNISEASRLLTMHRNSLVYRIKRIEELFDNNLEAEELRRQLLYSISCMEYDEKYIKRKE